MFTTLINWSSPGIILLLLLAFFGIIALVVWLIRYFVPGVDPDKGNDIDPDEALEEELDRVLVPFETEDETTAEGNEPSSEELDEEEK